jgi:hypothetical protein
MASLALFEKGRRDGQWTRERLQQEGWESARACLEYQEQVYQEALKRLPTITQPDVAGTSDEYELGVIVAARETLTPFIKEDEHLNDERAE